jgi:hypothetical protein
MSKGLANKLIFSAKVIDNEDTFLLGRIRCKPPDWPIQNILNELEDKGILNPDKDDILDKYKYTKDDPFVFMPLLPIFFNFVPKVGELIWLTYSDPSENWGKKEQFYISVVKTSPFNLFLEKSDQAEALTNRGSNLIPGTEFKSPNPPLFVVQGREFDYPQRQYRDSKIRGLFAEPGDNAIYGQGSTDLILKTDEILLRAGKTDLNVNKVMGPNRQRAFLQMSYFKQEAITKDPVIQEIGRVDDSPLRKLIEYTITNLENTFGAFNGSINVYDISVKLGIKNNEFTLDTEVPNLGSLTPIYSTQFTSQPMSAITDSVNYIIQGLNNGRIEEKREPFLIPARSIDNCFPFYYRPSIFVREILNTTPDPSVSPFALTRKLNANRLKTGVKFARASLNVDGNGLVSQKNKFGVSTISEKIQTQETEYNDTKNSVSILGSNKILLLSHESVVPGREPVDLNVDASSTSTMYGLSQDQIFGNLFNNSEPLVRGEKLKEFLTLLVKFLTTHVHPYHGMPPNPTSFSEVTIDTIEQEFQNYDSKVLNQNIRIN